MPDLNHILRFYFITDDNAPDCPPVRQVEFAIAAGAGIIQYRHKAFKPEYFKELESIRDLCRRHGVLLIVNDDIVLAKAVGANGVHVGQDDTDAAVARKIMGPDAIIGVSVSTMAEFENTDLSLADYIGTGPVYATGTKADASPVIGLPGLREMVKKSPVPVVAIGGIDSSNAGACFSHGAAGVAVISCISRSEDPAYSATQLAKACGCVPKNLKDAWNDEFSLIDKLTTGDKKTDPVTGLLKIVPGDDAALFETITRPVITTDTQKENIHFRRTWQSLAEIGQKAVEITFSDLAASYARPLSLFVNLAIPAYMADTDIEELYSGIGRSLEKYQASLGGGNVSSGKEFSIDLFALGEGHPDIFPLRSGARPGDGVYVTGPLGMARAGLMCLQKNDPDFPELVEKLKFPVARNDAAAILADLGVACVMDISDGLAGDAAHIAVASNVAIAFEPSGFKIDPALEKFCQKYQLDPTHMILTGGEDYELMFACAPEVFRKVNMVLPDAFKVGECRTFSGSLLTNLPEGVFSYQHGKK